MPFRSRAPHGVRGLKISALTVEEVQEHAYVSGQFSHAEIASAINRAICYGAYELVRDGLHRGLGFKPSV